MADDEIPLKEFTTEHTDSSSEASGYSSSSKYRRRRQTMVNHEGPHIDAKASGSNTHDIIEYDNDGSTRRGSNSFDESLLDAASVLTIDDHVTEQEQSTASSGESHTGRRWWPFPSFSYTRLGENGIEPIWNKRMLVFPAFLFLVFIVLVLGSSVVALWRSHMRNAGVKVNKNLFSSLVDPEALHPGQHTLRLVHTNDLHAHYEPFDEAGDPCSVDDVNSTRVCYGGSAYVKSVIDNLQYAVGARDNSILLNAGDEFQGTRYYSLFKGNISAQLLNAFGYDAMTLGNHEFDEGPLHLARFLELALPPVVCANLNFTADFPQLQSKIQPFTIIEQHSLGVIGVLTPETMDSSNLGGVIQITDPIDAVNMYIQKLKDKGITRIVLLSHLGYDKDQELAKAADPGLSLIVGGHTHSYLSSGPSSEDPDGPYPTWIGSEKNPQWQTAIVQAKKWGEFVGYLDLVFNPDGSLDSGLTKGESVHISFGGKSDKRLANIKPNAHVVEIIRPFASRLQKYSAQKIGEVTGHFVAPASAFANETEVGDLIADAMVWADFKERAENVPRIALMGTRSIWHGLSKGIVTRGDMLKIEPFDDNLVRVTMSGREIRDALSRSVNGNTSDEAYRSSVQVSGLRISSTKIEACSAGVVDHRPMGNMECAVLVDAREYRVLTTSFLANGGDNIFAGLSDRKGDLISSLRDAISNYIERFSPITPTVDGRISI